MSHDRFLDQSAAHLYLTAMLTRKHIEFGAIAYIILHLLFFIYWLFDVCQMMGFFGGK